MRYSERLRHLAVKEKIETTADIIKIKIFKNLKILSNDSKSKPMLFRDFSTCCRSTFAIL